MAHSQAEGLVSACDTHSDAANHSDSTSAADKWLVHHLFHAKQACLMHVFGDLQWLPDMCRHEGELFDATLGFPGAGLFKLQR